MKPMTYRNSSGMAVEPSALSKLFAEVVEKANFTFLEIQGFREKPKLALMAGMAIGYKLALEEIEKIWIKNNEISI